MADKDGGVKGVFLVLVGFVVIGIGAALYFGDLDFGSLTKNNLTQPVGNSLASIPVGLGALLIIIGLVVAVGERRAGPKSRT